MMVNNLFLLLFIFAATASDIRTPAASTVMKPPHPSHNTSRTAGKGQSNGNAKSLSKPLTLKIRLVHWKQNVAMTANDTPAPGLKARAQRAPDAQVDWRELGGFDLKGALINKNQQQNLPPRHQGTKNDNGEKNKKPPAAENNDNNETDKGKKPENTTTATDTPLNPPLVRGEAETRQCPPLVRGEDAEETAKVES